MAASGPSARRSKNKLGTAKPNLMPIMNLFLVIIPMLITMITATGLQMMAINIPTSGSGSGNGEGVESEEKKASIYLAIFPDKFQIRVDDEIYKEIPAINRAGGLELDYISLNKVIDQLKEENSNVEKIKLVPSNNIIFDNFIRTMDICKMGDRFPNIGYGFSQQTVIRK